jgi:hypothetical protein
MIFPDGLAGTVHGWSEWPLREDWDGKKVVQYGGVSHHSHVGDFGARLNVVQDNAGANEATRPDRFDREQSVI